MYKIQFDLKLEKKLRYIPKKDQKRILDFIENLEDIKDPYSLGVKLTISDNLYRYRVGNYRIVAEIKNKELTILIIDIADRKDIYRQL